VDVTTHLIDLMMWTCFPEEPIDYREDIRMLQARRWPHAVHRSLGDGRKRCTESELAVRGGARRSFYTAGPIRAGERFTAQSLLPLRPGSEGEHPEVWIGKEALRDYAPFERLDGGGR